MQKAALVNEFLSSGGRLKPKDRFELRKEIRSLVRDRFKDLESLVFKDLPVNPDMVGSILDIEFREGELDENTSAELKMHPERGFKYLAIINTLIDNEHHKRFSKFHECSHVLLNLFEGDNRAFRTPKINRNSTFIYKEPREIICDITASEMLFYYPLFEQKMLEFEVEKNLCEQIINLANIFNASLEATCRTLIENLPEKAFMLVVEENFRKQELQEMENNKFLALLNKNLQPKPRPRILYSVKNDGIDFMIPYNRSFEEDTIIHKSFYEKTNEDTTLNIESYGWGNGKFKLSAITEEDRCYCVGIGLD